ncbi:hypothetical protein BKA93DRAFT_191537 [Sparassis latifolia]
MGRTRTRVHTRGRGTVRSLHRGKVRISPPHAVFNTGTSSNVPLMGCVPFRCPFQSGEKTKWVPIPPQELQAAADALQQSRAPHSHARNGAQQHAPPRTQGSYPASGSGSTSLSASGSAQASQGQSRAHSSLGVRPSASHASSVSQSQVQSRTGSAHSSPRQPFTRRRLPEEGGAGVGPMHTVNRSIRSSRSGSPQLSAPPYVPPAEYNPRIAAMPYPPPNMGPPPESLNPDISNSIAYYQPNMSAPRSYNTSRGSPAQNPYALPPAMYPAQQLPGMPMNPYASAPYGLYSQFSYPYAPPPYMFWPAAGGPQPISSSPVPIVPPMDGGVPPPTMMARPPPPGESDAVAGYREVGFVLPPPAAYERVEEEAQGEVERGRRGRELSFGSIGVAGASKSPSPAPPSGSPAEASNNAGGLGLDTGVLEEKGSGEESGDKTFTTFSIGVAPGEPGPARIRSRTRTQSRGGLGDGVSLKTALEPSEPLAIAEDVKAGRTTAQTAAGEVEVKVIDLTDPETKWEFGTTKRAETEVEAREAGTEGVATGVSPSNALGMSPGPAAVPVQGEGYPPARVPSAQVPGYVRAPNYVPPVAIPPMGSTLTHLKDTGSPSTAPQSALPPTSAASSGLGDDWEVKDYGYGFGRGFAPAMTREEHMLLRERDRRDHAEREYYGRPRRGSYSGGYGYDRGGHERGGFERGGYSGRRGRGMYGGRGGYHSRNFSRGGYQQGPPRQPPFVVQPPQNELNSYYAPAPQPVTSYIPPAYEGYAYPPYAAAQQPVQPVQPVPPMPMPLSPLSFPLDPTRYYLLGQLEYYLSPQNMAQDFFLRQRMDSRGWISISLIASFNRVRQLTVDLQLVRDVLTLSSLVEVNGDWVRMRQWEQFVLPNAIESTVETELHRDTQFQAAEELLAAYDGAEAGSNPDGEGEAEGDEEDEEDVVFVLGRDANRPWTPERRPA